MAADVFASKLSYEEAKELAFDGDLDARIALAQRSDLEPEILYYLAQDDSSDVRQAVASNVSAPRQSFEILASDSDDDVRVNLASTVKALGDTINQDTRTKAQVSTHKTLTELAKDQLLRVRETIADALKDVAGVPADVIRILAGDSSVSVSAPILEHSSVLTDEDLLEIIEKGTASENLQAISRRSTVSETVSTAVVGTDDVMAIGELLGNPSAQIKEELLDDLIDRAADIEIWHEPLVKRPTLTPTAPEKLAHYIADHLLEILEKRNDLDSDTIAEIEWQVHAQLGETPSGQSTKGLSDYLEGPLPTALVEQLKKSGELSPSVIFDALQADDYSFVLMAIISLTGIDEKTVRRIFAERNPNGVVSLAWKSGLSPSIIVPLQHRMARIAPNEVLRPKTGHLNAGAPSFPLSEREMDRHIQFFDDMIARDSPAPN